MSQNELFHDACVIIEQAQRVAYQVVNETIIKRNWLLGMRIQHEVLKDQRAEYGEQVIKDLAIELTAKYKSGFTKTNLYNYIGFFQAWPNFFHATSGKSGKEVTDSIFRALSGISSGHDNILNSLRSKSPIRLSWTHYRIILQESTAEGRAWYENEAAQEMWSTRTLQRNVSSQYYHRLLQSQDKTIVHNEMVELTKPLQDKLEYLKSPVIAEFLGFKSNTDYSESNLEQSIIDHLISFLMELGKGFAFVVHWGRFSLSPKRAKENRPQWLRSIIPKKSPFCICIVLGFSITYSISYFVVSNGSGYASPHTLVIL